MAGGNSHYRQRFAADRIDRGFVDSGWRLTTSELADNSHGSLVPTAPPKKSVRIIGLDGIRGLGCLGVATAHIAHWYTPLTSNAAKLNLIGVVLLMFFVLSGFLLFLPYVKALVRDAGSTMPDTREYVLHRVLRVFPAYLVIFLVCNYLFRSVYVVNPTLQTQGSTDGTGMITDAGQLIANLTLMQTYLPRYFQTGINPAWSLTLEIAFYATLPIFGVLMFRLRRRTGAHPLRIALIAPVALLVLGLVGKLFVPAIVHATGVTDPALQEWGDNWLAVYLRSFLTMSDTFAYGMFAVVLFVAMERGKLPERISRRIRLIAVVAFFPAALLALGLLAVHNTFALSAISFGSAIFVVIVVAPLARGEKSTLAKWLDFGPARFLGKISLSVYLWHYPVLILLGRLGYLTSHDTAGGLLRNVALAMAVTFALSILSYYAIEKPALNLTKRYRPRPRAHPLPDRAGLA
jgi:peptidoglycan/LPS O-acetylase OafA/YrhL